MTPKLDAYTVLNTRPKAQAENLTQLIQREGVQVVHLPCIEIKDPPDIEAAVKLMADLNQYDYVVFVSSNAVHFAKQHWQETKARVIAIGSGTANALAKAKIPIDLMPEHYSSEGILALPELQKLPAKKILICCGADSRPLLAETLSVRGALVRECICYQRRCPQLSPNKLAQLVQTPINLIISTSDEGLHNLYTVLGETGRDWLLNTQLLIVSPKMLKSAKQLGFKKTPLVSNNASDAAILATLLEFRATCH